MDKSEQMDTRTEYITENNAEKAVAMWRREWRGQAKLLG